MTYHGAILFMSGWQADEEHVLKQYSAIMLLLTTKYPDGSLWLLHKAKIQRLHGDNTGAINLLEEGVKNMRPSGFVQADAMLLYELAWTLFSHRRYKEAAEAWLKLTDMNKWSHATYHFQAAGCYHCLGDYDSSKAIWAMIPGLLDKKKMGGREIPSETFIRKKILQYQQKQQRNKRNEADFVEAISISPAHELALFWNAHANITREVADATIRDLMKLAPQPGVENGEQADKTFPDYMDCADEFLARALLLGVLHRSGGHFGESRKFFIEVIDKYQTAEGRWIGVIVHIEMAVLELQETEASLREDKEVLDTKTRWEVALDTAGKWLDKGLSLCTNTVEMFSRVESRISMLRNEITLKREALAGRA